jgi:hypothetical protein
MNAWVYVGTHICPGRSNVASTAALSIAIEAEGAGRPGPYICHVGRSHLKPMDIYF